MRKIGYSPGGRLLYLNEASMQLQSPLPLHAPAAPRLVRESECMGPIKAVHFV